MAEATGDDAMVDGTMSRFWVGASTKGDLGSAARGIRPLVVEADGSARLGDPVDVGPNPMWIAWHAPDRLAVAHEIGDGLVSRWRVDGDRLVPVGPPGATGAADPCFLGVDDDVIVAANYSGSRVSAHPARADAAADAASWVDLPPRPDAPGPNAERQERPHPHQVVVDAARGRLLVPDLGSDRIRVLTRDDDGRLAHDPADDIPVHGGAGPRHVVITGDVAIVSNELDRTLSIVDLVAGRELRHVAAGPDAEPRGLGLSGIRLTAHGVALVGDRDADAVRAVRLDLAAETLELVATLPTGGRHPRDLQLTHDERHLLVADQASDSIAVIALDGGVPQRVVATIATPAPACLAREP